MTRLPLIETAKRELSCSSCRRVFTTHKVSVDGEIAARYYKTVAKLISAYGVALTKTSAHRIGGKGKERYRTALTGNALECCKVARSACPTFVCFIGEYAQRPSQASPPPGFRIISPINGSNVGTRAPVIGSINEDNAEGKSVWVLIKPEGDFFWVQRPSKVLNQRFRAEARFGDPYTPIGHPFYICIVIDPERSLEVGQLLREPPRARWISDLICVTLRRQDS